MTSELTSAWTFNVTEETRFATFNFYITSIADIMVSSKSVHELI